jgi:hypothetical protein
MKTSGWVVRKNEGAAPGGKDWIVVSDELERVIGFYQTKGEAEIALRKRDDRDLIKEIGEYAENNGLQVNYAYSGRGMFSDQCVAVSGPEANLDVFLSILPSRLIRETQRDCLGKTDLVYYWPSLKA